MEIVSRVSLAICFVSAFAGVTLSQFGGGVEPACETVICRMLTVAENCDDPQILNDCVLDECECRPTELINVNFECNCWY
jgi:hypothetical protein